MRHVGSCEIGCNDDRIFLATDHLICCADEIHSAASSAVNLQEKHLIAIPAVLPTHIGTLRPAGA